MAIAAASDLYAHSTNSADFLSIFPTKKVSFKSPWKPKSGKKNVWKKMYVRIKKKWVGKLTDINKNNYN